MEDSNFKINEIANDDYYPQSRNQLFEMEDQQEQRKYQLPNQSQQNMSNRASQISQESTYNKQFVNQDDRQQSKQFTCEIYNDNKEQQKPQQLNNKKNTDFTVTQDAYKFSRAKTSNAQSRVVEVKPIQSKVYQTEYSKRKLNVQQYSDDENVQKKFQIKQQKNPNLSTNESKTLQYVDYDEQSMHEQQQQQNSQSSDQENQRHECRQAEIIQKCYKKSAKEKLISFKGSNIYQLAYTSLPPKYRVKCLVKETKSFFSGDTYDLYLEDDKRHFLRATRGVVPLSSKFEIHEVKSKKKVGEMFKNFTGTQFVLYRRSLTLQLEGRQYCSEKATKNTAIQKIQEQKKTLGKEQPFNEEISWICFTPNLFGFSGQKSVTIAKRLKRAAKTERFSDLKCCWQQGDLTRIQILSQKSAQKRNGTYQLDFHGIVKLPSSKNTIIQDDKANECLIFGKRSQNIYSMHVNHPLSLIQAFSFAVSNLDRKLIVH